MNLYHWKAKCLRQYANGDIIVMAESVMAARRIVHEQIDAFHRERFDWMYDMDGNLYEDDVEEYEQFILQYYQDIAVEPTTGQNGFFIEGSQ